MQLISTLNTFPNEDSNVILKTIKEKIQNVNSVQSIELHLFSRLDMCPCSYQHMQNFLGHSNLYKDLNFFTKLMSSPEGLIKKVPVTFFVSSSCCFDKEKRKNDWIYSLYSYCDSRLPIKKAIEEKKINCIFLRLSKKQNDLQEVNKGEIQPFGFKQED